MRISGLSLVPVSVASVAVLFALSACGGGGGGTPSVSLPSPPDGGGSPPDDTSQALWSSVQAAATLFIPPVLDILLVTQSNPTPGCPMISREDDWFVLDFGGGCTNSIIGRASGTVRVRFVSQDRLSIGFTDFATQGFELRPVNGALAISVSSYNPINATIMGALRYGSGSCQTQLLFSSASSTGSSYSIAGTLITTRGRFRIVINHSYSRGCRWATAGYTAIDNGIARIDFLPNCGTARFNIAGLSEIGSLDALLIDYNPCN